MEPRVIVGRLPVGLGSVVPVVTRPTEPRQLLVYLEHSISIGLQWTVFEANSSQLWAEVRGRVTDFLTTQWHEGALVGATPAEAFFVRCDASTMTQNDLDNGRLVVVVGVAPTYPAEFVVFNIGQWTAQKRPPTP
jgi:uncharacterized protein